MPILSTIHLKITQSCCINQSKYHFNSRISGKFVISTFTLMEMLKESLMDQAGLLPANMEKENVKEILSKLVHLRNMTFTLKHFLSLSVFKVTLTIGLQVVKNALKIWTLIGTLFTVAQLQLKVLRQSLKLLKRLNLSAQLILMFHGLLSMTNIPKAPNQLFLQTWSDLFAQFTEAQLKLMPVIDFYQVYYLKSHEVWIINHFKDINEKDDRIFCYF